MVIPGSISRPGYGVTSGARGRHTPPPPPHARPAYCGPLAITGSVASGVLRSRRVLALLGRSPDHNKHGCFFSCILVLVRRRGIIEECLFLDGIIYLVVQRSERNRNS